MNAWFGGSSAHPQPWGLICNSLPHVATPVGELCLYCDEAIMSGEDGEMIDHFDYPENVSAGLCASTRPIHRACLVRSVVGSLGHQQKQCSCYGGNQEDPPGLSKRHAAIVACDYFERQVINCTKE